MTHTLDEQLQVSFDEPHHLTSLLYPMLDLLTGTETVSILPSLIYAQTHEPLKLIANDQVAKIATTDTPSEITFFIINRAEIGNLGLLTRPLTFQHNPLLRLMHDVAAFQRHAGTSTLKFVTLDDPRLGYNDGLVRVQRDSYVPEGGGHLSHSTSSYEFSIVSLIVAGGAPTTPPFVKSMAMLILRSSLRAYKHVRFYLAFHQHVFNDGHLFRPGRTTTYTDMLTRTITAFPLTDLAQDDRDCNICRFPYGQTMNPGTDEEVPSEQPVALQCGHCFGRACILQWAAADNDNCPLCRKSCLAPAVIKQMEFGLDENNTYNPDDRYSAHENFERSCADLDDHENQDYFQHEGPISWHRSIVLNRAFRLLLTGAILEDPLSTPQHLQAAHFPEMQAALQTLDKVWTRDQVVLDVSNGDLLRNMASDIRQALLNMASRQFSTPYLRQFVGPNDRWLWDNANADRPPTGYPLRPGFEVVLYRMLIRAIHFEGDRACNCSPGFHQHGLRTYYNIHDTYQRGDNGPGDS